MAQLQQADRVANREEVLAVRDRLRSLLVSHGLREPRLTDDGAVVVHAESYRGLAEVAVPVMELVGAHVRLILDTVPGAEPVGQDLLPL